MTIAALVEEDADVTEAKVTMRVRGEEFAGWGRARRTPDDPSIPAVGEELALARALHELSGHLVEAAASIIEEHEGVRPELHT
ncbi:MAG: dsRBD fold-containing protein [Actinomycetota bacterium]